MDSKINPPMRSFITISGFFVLFCLRTWGQHTCTSDLYDKSVLGETDSVEIRPYAALSTGWPSVNLGERYWSIRAGVHLEYVVFGFSLNEYFKNSTRGQRVLDQQRVIPEKKYDFNFGYFFAIDRDTWPVSFGAEINTRGVILFLGANLFQQAGKKKTKVFLETNALYAPRDKISVGFGLSRLF